uniref:Oncostatin M n=1 Tax=Sciurus vulgaris TaxID=55149 RepID=A0A8D2CPA5_SCIVU
MRARLTRRTLFSLVLGLLLLSTAAAMRGCMGPYQHLLSQLQRQAHLTEDTSSLLEPYIHLQGLNTPILRGSCTEHPGAFPSKDALRGLSKRSFLRTVNATLDRVLKGLVALQKQLLNNDLKELETARQNIQGIRNNIHCMSWLLGGSSETAEPMQTGPGSWLQLTSTLDVFQAKLEGCRFLRGYHRFMGSVGWVFREWGESPSRSRRHSPRWALHKGVRRTRLFRRGKRPVPRGQLPW